MPEEREESSESMARRHFHWCLAAAILPVISLPFEWFVAYGHRRLSETIPEHRRWSRWFLGLALVDTIVAVLVIALIASGVWGWHTLTGWRSQPRQADGVRIGVTIIPNPERPDEAQIGKVANDSPAEHAGLQPGDVLISVDGNLIRKVEDAAGMIRSGIPGVPRKLRIRRAGEEAEFIVTPEQRPAIREPAGALFDAAPTPSCLTDSVNYASTFFRWTGLWAAALLMILLWLVGLRVRPGAPSLWLWVVAALGSVVVAGPLVWAAVCLSAGGRSVGALLVARFAQSAAALIVGLVAMRHMAAKGLLSARLEPALGAGRAVVLGFFYMVAVNVRLSIFGTALEALAHVHVPAGSVKGNVASELGTLGLAGVLLLGLTVAVVGPVEEEVLFRGVILPRLASWTGAAWAIVASSAVFSVLHEGFGDEPFGLRTASVFLLALVLGWARLRTGGLAAPVTMHIATNALSLLASLGRHP
jgi:membrane protease YdiL (CAAX protease family)